MHNIAPSPRHLWRALPIVVLLGMLAQPASSQEVDTEASLFASPTTRDHIGRILVPVMVNGQGPYRFIVDTGANRSTISPGLVRLLGLKTSEEASIILDGITGSGQVSFVTVDRLQAGDLILDRTDLPVVWAPVMAGADGILGVAGLKEKDLIIDFQHNRVAFSGSIDAWAHTSSTRIHALSVSRGLITLDTRVAGIPVRAVVDTGAERTLGNLALRDALRARRTRRIIATVTSVYGATQEIESGEIQVVPPIVIDSLRISDVAVVFGSFHIFQVWEMQDKPAMIIGMDVLGTVASLSIDFKNKDVYLTSASPRSDILSTMHSYSSDPSQRR